MLTQYKKRIIWAESSEINQFVKTEAAQAQAGQLPGENSTIVYHKIHWFQTGMLLLVPIRLVAQPSTYSYFFVLSFTKFKELPSGLSWNSTSQMGIHKEEEDRMLSLRLRPT